MAESDAVRRRDVLTGIGAASAAGLAAASANPAPSEAASAPSSHAHLHPEPTGTEPTRFFTSIEAPIIIALVDTLIPKDEVGPGGVEAGVPAFLDSQMAGAYGRGARMYRQGPFAEGTPEQGYQLPLTPAELYRVGIADLTRWCTKVYGKPFEQLGAADRLDALKKVDAGEAQFAQVPPRTFFNLLLQNTIEGYFGDPLYGGNRGKAAWKMIGFPGAIGDYVDVIEEYRNKPYAAEPKSIRDLS
jgi:gluconate 2-dehydrogenase gamma chain